MKGHFKYENYGTRSLPFAYSVSSLKTRLCNRLTSPEARLDAGCELKESKLGPDSSKSIDLTKSLSGLVNDFQSVPLMLKRFI